MFPKLGPANRRTRSLFAVLSVAGLVACAGVLFRAGLWRSRGQAAPAAQSEDTPTRQRLREVHREAMELFRAGKYGAAADKFEGAWQEASREGDEVAAVRYLNNLGACHVAAFRYRDGMTAYLRARDIAVRTGDWEDAAGLVFNISALYLEMGHISSALEAAESGLSLLKDRPAPYYRARLLSQLARLRARTGQMEAAVRLFGEAVEEADRRADPVTQALAWNQLGYELLRAGELEAAEHALLEAYRIRKFTRDRSIVSSYHMLGLLRLAQGDLNSASRLLDQAVALAATWPRLIPRWRLHHDRGRVRMAQGLLAEALGDFRLAVDSARRWRPEVLPADPIRVSLEAGLQEVYSSFIEAGNRLYFLRGDPALARETFEAAEENRAYSLRMLMAEPEEWREKLPPDYGETLARLREAEAASITADSPGARRRIGDLHHRLTEMEARTGLDLPEAIDGGARRGFSERVQVVLGADEALLSFHLGEPASYVWGITRDSFELVRAPSRARLRDQVGRFVEAVKRGTPEAAVLAGRLHDELLSGLSAAARNKPHWLLTLDDVLFELPFAALAEGFGPGGPRFLIEGHSLQVVPSAQLLVSTRAEVRRDSRADGSFLGVGDPVYNTADPRWKGGAGTATGAKQRVELPRLAGSSREIRDCARVWGAAGAPPVLLEGPAATREAVLQSLERRPGVAHFATHVVLSLQKRGMIALSLLPGGESDLLSPLEIAHRRRSPSLVVLSGCSSAQGETLPGTGLMGLTRAWLGAGADTVVASRWPTADDSGELFLCFYRHLRAGWPAPAVALQRAQVEMLQSPSWRSLPKYWAAYFAVGRE